MRRSVEGLKTAAAAAAAARTSRHIHTKTRSRKKEATFAQSKANEKRELTTVSRCE